MRIRKHWWDKTNKMGEKRKKGGGGETGDRIKGQYLLLIQFRNC